MPAERQKLSSLCFVERTIEHADFSLPSFNLCPTKNVGGASTFSRIASGLGLRVGTAAWLSFFFGHV